MPVVASLVPESPMVPSAFPSPDLRQPGPSARSRTVSYTAPSPVPRFLSAPSPSSLSSLLEDSLAAQRPPNGALDKGKGNNVRAAVILRQAIRWAIDHGDHDLLTWIVGLGSPWDVILDEEMKLYEDEDGWGLVGTAIQASCGRQEMEEAVRLIVGRWGMTIGPREGRDLGGWTSLHLAALISTPPLVSFLLTRGASPQALTKRGLTPYDLISGMDDRKEIAVLLDHSSASALIPPAADPSDPSLSARRQAMLQKRRNRALDRMRRKEEDDKAKKVEHEREAWIREMAKVVEVAPDLLLPPKKGDRSSMDTMRRSMSAHWNFIDDLEGGSDAESEAPEAGEDAQKEMDDLNSTTLAYSSIHLERTFDVLITTCRPQCLPLAKRTLPANVLYLHARFAHYRCDETWLEEFIEGAVDRIEQGVYGNLEDLAYLSFWAYNTTVLLHFIHSDGPLNQACEELGLHSLLEELINAINVFIIRVAERRIDAVLDGALLDHETLSDFDDVRFEGDWNIFKSIAARKKRDLGPKSSQIFANGAVAPSAPPVNDFGGAPSSPSYFGSLRENVAIGLPFKSRQQSATSDTEDLVNLRSVSIDSAATISAGDQAATAESDTSPRRITEILSAVLLIMQLYEVNPAFIIQDFSQIFFWIASELFNRILTRKKYLCRSKAVQIKMNITVLEDWVRANGLPTKIASKHLEPVSQLLQWLQCSSQIRQFDTLIGTMQSLKAINPLQMRRAVRDYKFEVNEGKMTDECVQYLAQLQKDWEKRRVQISVEAMQNQTQRQASDSSNSTQLSSGSTDNATRIDALFNGTTAMGDFMPQSAPECLGELLDSRFMLLFMLPSESAWLVATPTFDSMVTKSHGTPFIDDGSLSSRPPSRASFASTKPIGWALPDDRRLRELPRDFFTWLKEKQAELRRKDRDSIKVKKVVPALDNALGPSQRINTPTRAALEPLRGGNTDDVDDENTPVFPYALPVSGRLRGDRASPALIHQTPERLKQNAQIIFDSEGNSSHRRSESVELKPRLVISPHASPRTFKMVPKSAPLPRGSQLPNGGPYPIPWEKDEESPYSPTLTKRWWQKKISGDGESVGGEEGTVDEMGMQSGDMSGGRTVGGRMAKLWGGS